MGDSVKTVVGIAAAIFAPQIATFMLGAGATATALALTTAAVTLVGASIAGSAVSYDAPDLTGVDGYSGQKLQTQKSNTAPVPILYGNHKIAGNIIWQDTNSAVNTDSATNGYNRDYWAVIVFSDSNFNQTNNVYSNEDTLTAGFYGGGYTYASEYVHVRVGSTAIDTAQDIQNLIWGTDDIGGYDYGSNLSLPSVSIPENVSYMLVHQVFDGADNKNTQIGNITIDVNGRTIHWLENATTINQASKIYTTNPAEILLNLMNESLSIDYSQIDIASFYQAKLDCNTNGFTCNIALIQQANVQSIIQDIIATCRGQIVRSDSKWKFKVDKKQQTSVAFLDNDDVLNNSLSISMAGSKDIANNIIVKYVNPSDEWLSAQVEKSDSELVTLDGQTLEKTLDIKGVTSQTQANKLAEITLNTMRYSEDALGARVKQTPLRVAFATTVKNAHLEVGDIFDLQHDILDRTRKFMILSVETDQSGLIQITAREYAETHYKDSAGNYLI